MRWSPGGKQVVVVECRMLTRHANEEGTTFLAPALLTYIQLQSRHRIQCRLTGRYDNITLDQR
jgi:hypothetical protein